MKETHSRSIIKEVSWRFFATLVTMLAVFIFTGKLALSLGVGAIDIISKLALYYFHERFWDKIEYGKR